METKRFNQKSIIIAVVLVLIAGISFFGIAGYASSADNYDNTISSLEEKTETVMQLTAAASASSCAISLIPGDGGTPIAEKLADLSGYFMIILTAIFLEKWLVTVTGFLAFRIIIPIACLALAAMLFFANDSLRIICVKLICFALMIFAVVPASVVLSDLIDDSYQATIQQTIDDAEKNSSHIQDNVGNSDDENAIIGFFKKLKGGVTGQIEKFENILNGFIESIAVLIVTSCIIPIAVLSFFIWLIKLMTGVDVRIPKVRPFEKIRRPGSQMFE